MIELTADNMAEFVSNDGLLVVEFRAEWCHPCKALTPTLETLEREGVLKVGTVDVDANMGLCDTHGIRSVPTMQFYKGGKLLDTAVGVRSRPELLLQVEGLAKA